MNANWTNHIASIWADVLTGRIKNNDTVVEFAAGGTDKIGRALNRLNWRGTLYVVEPETLSLHDTVASYKRLLPQCSIVPVRSTLDAFNISAIDVLLSNHPLDDMIIGNTLKSNEFDELFNDHYTKPLANTERMWQRLSASDTQSSIRMSTNSVLSKMRVSRTTIISQYRSTFFTENGFCLPDDVAHKALTDIRNRVSGRLIRDNRWLIA